jgi:hypothetical protein
VLSAVGGVTGGSGHAHAGVVSTIGDVVIGERLTRLTGDRYVTTELSGRSLA